MYAFVHFVVLCIAAAYLFVLLPAVYNYIVHGLYIQGGPKIASHYQESKSYKNDSEDSFIITFKYKSITYSVT